MLYDMTCFYAFGKFRVIIDAVFLIFLIYIFLALLLRLVLVLLFIAIFLTTFVTHVGHSLIFVIIYMMTYSVLLLLLSDQVPKINLLVIYTLVIAVVLLRTLLKFIINVFYPIALTLLHDLILITRIFLICIYLFINSLS
jgi:hypothetical protein